MTKLIVTLGTLSFLTLFISGCESRSDAEVAAPAPIKSTFAKIKEDQMAQYSPEGKAFIAEVCQALGGTPNFDSGARRDILKDYEFDLAEIATVEEKMNVLFGPLGDKCEQFLGSIISGVI